MKKLITLELGKDIERVVDPADYGMRDFDLLSSVAQHIFHIGLENVVKDSHASITKIKFPETYRRLSEIRADEKLAALRSGEVRKMTRGNHTATAVAKLAIAEFLAMKSPEEVAAFTAELIANSTAA